MHSRPFESFKFACMVRRLKTEVTMSKLSDGDMEFVEDLLSELDLNPKQKIATLLAALEEEAESSDED